MLPKYKHNAGKILTGLKTSHKLLDEKRQNSLLLLSAAWQSSSFVEH
jgi:hypothetical protein